MKYALVTAAVVALVGGGVSAASAAGAHGQGHGHGGGDICILDSEPGCG